PVDLRPGGLDLPRDLDGSLRAADHDGTNWPPGIRRQLFAQTRGGEPSLARVEPVRMRGRARNLVDVGARAERIDRLTEDDIAFRCCVGDPNAAPLRVERHDPAANERDPGSG